MTEEHEGITKFLPCKLTEEEVRAKAADLATTITDLKELEQEFDAVKKSMSEQVKAKEKEIEVLAKIVRDKIENREVECYEDRVDRNLTINVIRADTYEIVQTRPMTETERQLVMFPQRPRLVPAKPGNGPEETPTAEIAQEPGTESEDSKVEPPPPEEAAGEPEPKPDKKKPGKKSKDKDKGGNKTPEPPVPTVDEKLGPVDNKKEPVPEELI